MSRGWEKKERTTEAEVDGRCNCRHKGEGTVGDLTQKLAQWR